MTTKRRQIPGAGYEPKVWERVLFAIVGIYILGFTSYLILDNKPLSRDLVIGFRLLLAAGAAMFGALLPGFLHLDWRGRGFAMRAGGAVGLFVLTFFGAPHVSDKLSATEYYKYQFASGSGKDRLERLNAMAAPNLLGEFRTEEGSRRVTERWINESRDNVEVVIGLLRLSSEMGECVASGECDRRAICNALYNEVDNFWQGFGWYFKDLKPHYGREIQNIGRFRTCDCFENAREKHCSRMKEWCSYPASCPPRQPAPKSAG